MSLRWATSDAWSSRSSTSNSECSSRGSRWTRYSAASPDNSSPRAAARARSASHEPGLVEFDELVYRGGEQARSKVRQRELDARRRGRTRHGEPASAIVQQRVEPEDRRVPLRVRRDEFEPIQADEVQLLTPVEHVTGRRRREFEVRCRLTALAGCRTRRLQQVRLARARAPPDPDNARPARIGEHARRPRHCPRRTKLANRAESRSRTRSGSCCIVTAASCATALERG